MKNNIPLILFIFLVFLPFGTANAFCRDTRWEDYKGFNAYLDRGRDTQNPSVADKTWAPADWIGQSEDAYSLIQGFFETDILRRETSRGDVTKLVVGPSFYRLGRPEKHRVIATYDAVYGITEGKQEGREKVILLEDWLTRRAIGIYSAAGLQLE